MSDLYKIRQLGLKLEFDDFLEFTHGDHYYFDSDHGYEGYCYECRDDFKGVGFLETEDEQVCEHCLTAKFFSYREQRHKSKLALVVGDAFFSGPSTAKLKLIK